MLFHVHTYGVEKAEGGDGSWEVLHSHGESHAGGGEPTRWCEAHGACDDGGGDDGAEGHCCREENWIDLVIAIGYAV